MVAVDVEEVVEVVGVVEGVVEGVVLADVNADESVVTIPIIFWKKRHLNGT